MKDKVRDDEDEDREICFIDYDTNVRKMMKQKYLDINDLRQNLWKRYEIYAETENIINTLWEVQIRDPLHYKTPDYDEIFLFKHVATGCFLALGNNDSLALTYDGTKASCCFSLN